jgi:hypothetical protein
MTARRSGVRTPPEVEAEIVRLVRDGLTRGQVAKAAGVRPQTVSRVIRDTDGLEFARTGPVHRARPRPWRRHAVFRVSMLGIAGPRCPTGSSTRQRRPRSARSDGGSSGAAVPLAGTPEPHGGICRPDGAGREGRSGPHPCGFDVRPPRCWRGAYVAVAGPARPGLIQD